MQHRNLIVSIPKEIKNKIDAEFGKEYSKAGLEKIYFIYFKINKEGNNYQVNSTNHTWMLGYKNRGELGQILKRLKDNIFLIKISEAYSIGYKSNSYSVIKPYDYKNENCYTIRFYDGQVKFPTWVQKYIADGGNAKNSETTNWVKITTKSANKESEKDIEIKRLQALLQANGISYSIDEGNSLENVKTPVVVKSVPPFKAPVKKKPIAVLIENEKYNISNNTYVIDENTSVTNAGLLVEYFQNCETDSTKLIEQLIADAPVRNYLIINDFYNRKAIKGKKVKQDNRSIFSISEIV